MSQLTARAADAGHDLSADALSALRDVGARGRVSADGGRGRLVKALRDRGLIDADGAPTALGQALRDLLAGGVPLLPAAQVEALRALERGRAYPMRDGRLWTACRALERRGLVDATGDGPTALKAYALSMGGRAALARLG